MRLSLKLHDSLGSGMERGSRGGRGVAGGAACRVAVTRARWKVAEGAHQFWNIFEIYFRHPPKTMLRPRINRGGGQVKLWEGVGGRGSEISSVATQLSAASVSAGSSAQRVLSNELIRATRAWLSAANEPQIESSSSPLPLSAALVSGQTDGLWLKLAEIVGTFVLTSFYPAVRCCVCAFLLPLSSAIYRAN